MKEGPRAGDEPNANSNRRPHGEERFPLALKGGGLPRLGDRLELETTGYRWAARARGSASVQAAEGREILRIRDDDKFLADPRTGVAMEGEPPKAAMCVQDIDVQCVLQFTSIHAAGCALHRHTSRVIHRFEFSLCCSFGRRC